MPRPSSKFKKSKPMNRPFTDRETFREAYNNAIEKIKTEEIYVLNFYGYGGIGKTRLLKKLQETTTVRQLGHYVTLDFKLEAYRQVEPALVKLREQFKGNHKVVFPLFDLAYTIYLDKTSPHHQISLMDVSFLEKGDVVWDVLGVLSELPVFDIASSAVKVGTAIYSKLKDKFDTRLTTLMSDLNELEGHEIKERLPFFFAEDLNHHIRQTEVQFIIFFDTYEALWHDEFKVGNQSKVEEWIREGLCANTNHVLYVISGRDRIRWVEDDSEWAPYVDDHIMGELSPVDTENYLVSQGVEMQDIRSNIQYISKGNPMLLNLCLDYYQQIEVKRKPSISDFSTAIKPKDLIEKLIGHLSDVEAELLKLLSLAKYWDTEMISLISNAFNLYFPDTKVGNLKELSIISYDKVLNVSKMHDLACDYLNESIDVHVKEKLLLLIVSNYQDRMTVVSIKSVKYQFLLQEVLIQGLKLNEIKPFAVWYLAEAEKAFKIGKGLLIIDNLKLLLAALEKSCTSVRLASLIGEILMENGKNSDAIALMFPSYQEKTTSPLMRLTTIIGRAYHRKQQWDQAEKYYRISYDMVDELILLKTFDIYITAIENGIRFSKLLLQKGEFDESDQMMLRVLHWISEANKNTDHDFLVEEARVLEKRSELYGQLKEYKTAFDLGLEAEEIYKVIDDSKHSVKLFQDYGLLMKRMAENCVHQENLIKADDYYALGQDQYQKCLEMDYNNVENHRRMGFLLRGRFRNALQINRYDEAINYSELAGSSFREALELNSSDASMVSAIGGLFEIYGVYQNNNNKILDALTAFSKAIVKYDEAINLNDVYPYAYERKAFCLIESYKINNSDHSFLTDAEKCLDQVRVLISDPYFIRPLQEMISKLKNRQDD